MRLLFRHAEQLDDIIFEIKRRLVRAVTFHRYPLFVDQELGEIPLDKISQSSPLFLFQILIQWMRVFSVDIDLRIHIESDLEIFDQPLLNLRLGPRLLILELIAWKSGDGEVVGGVLIV